MTANLEMAKAAIENNCFIKVEIEEIYIDFGANWKELALVSKAPKEYQILNPRQVENANAGMLSMEDLQSVIDEINKRGW